MLQTDIIFEPAVDTMIPVEAMISDENSLAPQPESTEVKPGYVRDYVSGSVVKASPEEVEALQIFARRLVEDYGYPINCLQTRPQFRVRKRPSDEAKTYPVNIAVFKGTSRTEDDL